MTDCPQSVSNSLAEEKIPLKHVTDCPRSMSHSLAVEKIPSKHVTVHSLSHSLAEENLSFQDAASDDTEV